MMNEIGVINYLLVILAAGFGSWFSSYFKEKGRNLATKEDFNEITRQLEKNTEIIEDVKNRFSEKGWITQQVWLKKQEAYQSIFSLLLNVRKYVSHQVSEFEEWEYINQYHPYIQNGQFDSDGSLEELWKKDKSEYEEKSKSPECRKEAEKLKVKYESSIAKLFDLLDIHAIYLDDKVEKEISKLRRELSTTDEDEEYDCHFNRISKATREAIDSIRLISKTELKIGI